MWIPSIHDVDYTLYHSWVRNFKPHGITGGFLKYYDVDVEAREKLQAEWNRPNYLPVAVAIGLAAAACVALAVSGKGRVTRRVGR